MNSVRQSANAASSFVRAALAQPDKVALHYPVAGDYARISYGQLLTLSDSYARGLQRAGVEAGERAALLFPPGPDYFALSLALFRAGIVPVFIDPAGGAAHIKRCFEQAQPRVFIGTPRALLANTLLGWSRGSGSRGSGSRGKKSLTVVTSGFGLSLKKWRGNASNPNSIFETAKTQPSDLAAIFFTSGSTGHAKGVRYSHANLTAQLELLKQLYPPEPDTVDLPTLPAFAFFDLALGLTAVLANTLHPARVNLSELVTAINRFGVTQMFASPVLVDRLGRYAEQDLLTSLRRVVTAGAAAEPGALARLSRALPEDAQLLSPYGATECLPISSLSSTVLADTAEKTAAGWGICVGKLAPDTRVYIIRVSDAPLAVWHSDLKQKNGQVGEVVVRGKQVSEAHLDEAANRQHKIDDHGVTLHRTGDLGYFDKVGRLWLVGRKSQRLETAEGPLYTLSCERIFQRHPAVLRAALVGVMRGEKLRPVLCAELLAATPKSEQANVRRDLLELAQSSPVTASIRLVLFHPGLPTDKRHNSKILREQLAGWADKRLRRLR